MKSFIFLSKKRTKYSFQLSHAIILCLRCETDIRTRIISGPQSFYFMINLFALEINEEMTIKKCCESKHYYILYKLAISVGIELEL